MLRFQKSIFDRTNLGYDFSSSNIAFSSTAVFVSPANNEYKTGITSENIDKGKSILDAPSKLEKKETRNPRIKKVNNKQSQPKKPHLCHHCRALGHTHPNCYKWLATQQSNSTISSKNQNQFPSSSAPTGDLLKAFMFLSNLNGFNSSPSPSDQRFAQRKGSSKVWKKKGSKWFSHFFSFFLPLWFLHYLCVLLSCFWVSLVLCFALFNMFLFVVFSFFFTFFHKNKKKIKKKI